MPIITKYIKLDTKGDTEIINITDNVQEAVTETKLSNGTVTVFVPGSTGGITTVEYEPGLVEDLKVFFEKIAPKTGHYEHNIRWKDGNGYAHVRASLIGPSLSCPFVSKKLQLGTWQQIIFIDFDNRPRSREIILQIIGEKL